MVRSDFSSKNNLEFLEQIAQLERQLFPNDAWTAQSIENLLQADINDVLIFQQDDVLQGYCLYQKLFETAEILRIGVNPRLQQQGIGTQIFVQLIQILVQRLVETLMLEVRADNFLAINFYKKHGFSQIHTRKGYYLLNNGQKIDGLILQKQLWGFG